MTAAPCVDFQSRHVLARHDLASWECVIRFGARIVYSHSPGQILFGDAKDLSAEDGTKLRFRVIAQCFHRAVNFIRSQCSTLFAECQGDRDRFLIGR